MASTLNVPPSKRNILYSSVGAVWVGFALAAVTGRDSHPRQRLAKTWNPAPVNSGCDGLACEVLRFDGYNVIAFYKSLHRIPCRRGGTQRTHAHLDGSSARLRNRHNAFAVAFRYLIPVDTDKKPRFIDNCSTHLVQVDPGLICARSKIEWLGPLIEYIHELGLLVEGIEGRQNESLR